MICRVVNNDDTITDVHVEWHPRYIHHLESGDVVVNEGLWTTIDRIKSQYERHNAFCRQHGFEERCLDDVMSLVEGAEAPIDVYSQTNDGCPWKHPNNFLATIQYSRNQDYWLNHA